MKIIVSIGGRVLRTYSYGRCRTKDQAIQCALELVMEYYLGPDIDPWPYIHDKE